MSSGIYIIIILILIFKLLSKSSNKKYHTYYSPIKNKMKHNVPPITEEFKESEKVFEEWAYELKENLLTENEKKYYTSLLAKLPAGYTLFTKIRVADIITPRAIVKKQTEAFRKISQKHFDFVLADSSSLTPLLVIELDDSSHDTPNAQKSDKFKDVLAFSKHVNVPLLRVRLDDNPIDKTLDWFCPNCHKILKIRVNSNNGNKFRGCPNYPDCRYTKNL